MGTYLSPLFDSQPNMVSPTIGAFSDDSPAERAGLKVGDRVLTIDGIEVERWDDIKGGYY